MVSAIESSDCYVWAVHTTRYMSIMIFWKLQNSDFAEVFVTKTVYSLPQNPWSGAWPWKYISEKCLKILNINSAKSWCLLDATVSNLVALLAEIPKLLVIILQMSWLELSRWYFLQKKLCCVFVGFYYKNCVNTKFWTRICQTKFTKFWLDDKILWPIFCPTNFGR